MLFARLFNITSTDKLYFNQLMFMRCAGEFLLVKRQKGAVWIGYCCTMFSWPWDDSSRCIVKYINAHHNKINTFIICRTLPFEDSLLKFYQMESGREMARLKCEYFHLECTYSNMILVCIVFLHSHHVRKYWFYVKNDFRNFHKIFTFWDPLSQKKRFLRKCLSVGRILDNSR